ncbi:hypothetical protein Patl1_26130 [Pistacia atlantica]|uniref:Uncharacterized protein n=1 Tax=Pistacia atlantica TaxID=434234 RepID=A0ACC1AZE6_9ROSI|nr:hypothetical protein Patl1_26130 [Pistacia atlantica]
MAEPSFLIISQQPDLKVHTVHDEYTCFQYSERYGELYVCVGIFDYISQREDKFFKIELLVDEAFPNVTFHFENSVFLKVYPHEYLFPFEGLWCIGWQNSGMQSRDRKNVTLLGDLVLSNKLVLYDLENQVIGWTEYNCTEKRKEIFLKNSCSS